MNTEQSNLANNPILNFFSNPIVGILGSLSSIVSVGLAIFFFLQSIENPNLTFVVNPVKAVVVKSGQASRITTLFDGERIDTDITAAQVAIWNRGASSIKQDSILREVTIRTENSAPILEATVRNVSRDLIKLNLDKSQTQQGILGIEWEILERGDGGTIQIVYAADPNKRLLVDGIVEGQKKISSVRTSNQIRTAQEQYSRNRRFYNISGGTLILLGVCMFFLPRFVYLGTRRRREKRVETLKQQLSSSENIADADFEKIYGDLLKPLSPRSDKLRIFFTWVYPIMIIGMGAYLIYIQGSEPPFGF